MAGAAAASGRELLVVVVVVSLGMEVMNTAAERWKKDRQAEVFVGSICLACKEQLGTQIRSRSGEGLKAEEGGNEAPLTLGHRRVPGGWS